MTRLGEVGFLWGGEPGGQQSFGKDGECGEGDKGQIRQLGANGAGL